MKIRHALVTVRWRESLRLVLVQQLGAERVTLAEPGSHAAREALREADVAILNGNPDRHVLEAPCLRWVHCDHAGIDGFAPPELLDGRFIVTTSAGRSASAVAEHALYFMLALSHEAPRLWRAQRRRVWGLPGLENRRSLQGRTLVIVGCGHSGSQMARYCRVMGMTVVGYRRRVAPVPAGFDEVYAADAGDRLRPLLERAQVLVLAASLNDTSRGLIGVDELAALPRGAYLINVARGALVDEQALLAALERGHLGGAGLDVATMEPLPPTSPLWSAPRTLITPHATPLGPDRDRVSLELIGTLIDQYRRGEPLSGALDSRDVYTSPQRPSPVKRRLTRFWARLASLS
ncbi:D-2-hydroxyacid dehydrogenase [Thiocapsa roseopersicina]|uniref:Phosphoglycerate dehydrogenase n=1 Tax=Thiocapsa roseopersicina TaxID=1058 RepID=A0A1H2WC97_THIRO|nr:D-2-hydroxyacid dehydrogenase [Thiocapsa roseopersicina]SDW78242.1 Phosphoglycerate dehydrogenase [Thiocapsa roseopersicina]